MRDFEAWMGVTGNILDYSYETGSNLPDITYQLAIYCVTAAQIDTKYCPFAAASLNAANPAADVVNRINNLTNYLSSVPDVFNSRTNVTYQFFDFQSSIWSWDLALPGQINDWAQYCLDIEQTIQAQKQSNRMRRDSPSSGNLTFASFDPDNAPFAGTFNPFPVTACVESSFVNIHDNESFIDYVSKQLAINPVIGYRGVFGYGYCVGWPNLTSYDVEKFTGPFPSQINNQIVIVARTYNLGFPMGAALNTYKFVGDNNAIVLVEDGFGREDSDDCMTSIIQDYFANGTKVFSELISRYNSSEWDNLSC